MNKKRKLKFEDGKWHCCECWAEEAEANLEAAMNQDRSALETHQASIINLPDKDVLAIAGRLLYRAEEAEAKLAEAQRELTRLKSIEGGILIADLQDAERRAKEKPTPEEKP